MYAMLVSDLYFSHITMWTYRCMVMEDMYGEINPVLINLF